MTSSAFLQITNGILQSATPVSAGFVETGADTGGSGWLLFPAPLPSSPQHLWFFSYNSSDDAKNTLLGSRDSSSRHGVTQDWNGTPDGAQRPELEVLIDSGAASFPMTPRALGDRLHLLISQEIVGTDARVLAYLWDEASGAWSEEVNTLVDNGTSTTFPYGTRAGASLFAAVGGQRRVALVSYRAALWSAAELTGGLPDITQASVRDTFTTGVNIVDPANSHSAFGTPLYDIYGPAATYNAGTNLGSGGDFSVGGTFT